MKTLFYALVLLLLNTNSAFAVEAAHNFIVIDKSGNPVSNAVIEVLTTAAASTPSKVAVMDQVDKQFKPQYLVVQQGQSVVFPNNDNIRHHVYSFSPAKRFEIKLYAEYVEAPILFEKQGVVVLGCNIHDRMVGYIYVAGSSYAALTGKAGTVEIIAPMEINSIRVWHNHLSLNGLEMLTMEVKDLEISDINGTKTIRVPLDMDATEEGNDTDNRKRAADSRNKFRKFSP